MKIFISAYACEPYKGSEPGIGWNFVNELANYHEVHVLTRSNNKESIDKYNSKNITFHYYDVPKWLSFWKKGKRGYQTYYYLWQLLAYKEYNTFVNNSNFDVVHHLTFGANWMGSLFMNCKPKTIWGPVGSEDIYEPIVKTLPFKIKVKELFRTFVKSFFYYIEPVRWITLSKSDLILNHSSKYAKYTYPNFVKNKVQDCTQTGLNITDKEYLPYQEIKSFNKDEKIKLLICSELVAWKGVLISSKIFSILANELDNIELIVIGDGPQKNDMKKIFEKYNVSQKVTFKGFVDKEEMLKSLYHSDILLYPAYHHGLATIILQSMYCFLPIISMAGDIISDTVHNNCGLSADGKTYKEIEKNLLINTKKLIQDNDLRIELSKNGRKILEEKYTWEKLTININKIYKGILNG